MKKLFPPLNIILLLLPVLWMVSVTSCLAATPNAIQFKVQQFKVEGDKPLSDASISDYFRPLQQQKYNLKELQDVGKGLEQLIRDEGYPFYRVVLPPQTLNGGEVTFKIISFELGKIEVSGNQYFDKNNILASLPDLKNTRSPNTQKLSEAIKVSNKHPSKQVQLVFKQSEIADKVDATVQVIDQRPYSASLFINNAGTRGTGGFRMTGSLQYSNLWGLDHVVNASYTTSFDYANKVQQYGGSYSLPVYPLKGWLSAYYAYSNVNTGTVATDLTVTGSGEMYGIHYQQFLPKIGRYEHSLDLGIDNRYFINDIQFKNAPLGSNVRSAPFSIRYQGEVALSFLQLGGYAQWVGNTDFGGHNTQNYYQQVRLGSKQNWDLLRYGANAAVNYQQWIMQVHVLGQFSSSPLIAGEQLGIGGNYDVMGYEQRETSADSGQIMLAEISTPAWKNMNLFSFYNYGHGSIQNALPGTIDSWHLSSVGAGLRVQWQQYLMANVAYANALNNGVTTREGDSRIIANLVLRY